MRLRPGVVCLLAHLLEQQEFLLAASLADEHLFVAGLSAEHVAHDPAREVPIGSTVTAIASSTEPCTPWSGSRIQYQPATHDYVARCSAEGKTSREIKGCLARYVGRDLYRLLENPTTAA